MNITSPCPSCRKQSTVAISSHHLICSECDFKVAILCPICHSDIEPLSFSTQDELDGFDCDSCQNRISLFQIKQIIETPLTVDYQKRCSLCNSPTVHQAAANMGHRCFFFPKCSGQVGLFGKPKSVVFLDFETTGLDIGIDEIIEVGALKIDTNGMETVFQKMVKPMKPIPPAITQITGISNEMVAEASPLKSIINDLKLFIGSASIVAHNADFDMVWLVSSYIKHQIEIGQNTVVCTLNWAKALKEARCSLGALTKKYGIGHQNAHRALADAVATKEIYFIFDQLNRESKPSVSIDSFLDMSEKIISRSTALATAT